jgi:UDPglucose 6-dehydrogenase
MKAGMGDGGSCHPRDNIALRWLANEYELGYDLFDAIMTARELQAKNIADKLSQIKKENPHLEIVIMGESFKPGVPYTDGSYTKLISHYLDGKIVFDRIEEPAIYLLGHRGIFNDTNFPNGSIVLDPWRERKKSDTIYYEKKINNE